MGGRGLSGSSNTLSSKELGTRLRVARDRTGSTQDIVAEKIGVSRTTLLAIEQGKRRVRDAELVKLSTLYELSINDLLRRDAIYVDLVPQFRRMGELDDIVSERAVTLLNDFVSAEVELESILGVRRTGELPPERPLRKGDPRAQGKEDAMELRMRLGLHNAPVRDIFSIASMDLGIRLYTHPLSGDISGVFAYEPSIGACILVNASHPYEKQVQTVAHETGHLVGTRHQPDVYTGDDSNRSRAERYARGFGHSFVLPARLLMEKAAEIRAGDDRLTRRHVILLSHYFAASHEAVVRRLEAIGGAVPGSWDWFVENGNITQHHVHDVLGDQSTIRGTSGLLPTSVRLETLAAQALERELMSEGQIASLLKIPRIEVRRIKDESENEGPGDDQLLL